MTFLKSSLTVLAAMAFSLSAIAQTSSSTTAASSSTTLKKAAAKPSPLSFTYFSETYVGVEDANHGDFDTTDNYHYLRAKYKTSNTETIELRQYFHTNNVEDGKGTAMGRTDSFIGDTAIQYVNKKQARIAGRDATGIARLYIPTGRESQDNQTAQLRGYLVWNTPISKNVTFETFTSPRLYNSFKRQAGQTGAALVTSADFQYKFNDTFTANFNPYLYNIWRRAGLSNAGDRVASNADSINFVTGLTANITKKIWLQTVIEHNRDLRAKGENFYDDGSTLYGLILSASM